mmetsp:Transcript_8440/g.21371  ORF Transcript_8440/g.21371 Transcript_8440/m.21371 type:complete len:245 (-) Transcript_8440:398-1132(-)
MGWHHACGLSSMRCSLCSSMCMGMLHKSSLLHCIGSVIIATVVARVRRITRGSICCSCLIFALTLALALALCLGLILALTLALGRSLGLGDKLRALQQAGRPRLRLLRRLGNLVLVLLDDQGIIVCVCDLLNRCLLGLHAVSLLNDLNHLCAQTVVVGVHPVHDCGASQWQLPLNVGCVAVQLALVPLLRAIVRELDRLIRPDPTDLTPPVHDNPVHRALADGLPVRLVRRRLRLLLAAILGRC